MKIMSWLLLKRNIGPQGLVFLSWHENFWEKKIFFFLIQVHHEMAKYHEVGRFVLGDSKDEKLIDWESAIFHEEHAAELGELEAMVTMAKLYLGQDREVLVNCVVEVRRS